MDRLSSLFFLLLLKCICNNLWSAGQENLTADYDFCESFIDCYDFSVLGKYSHEYHPRLLSYARESIKKLEEVMAKKISAHNSRLVIMGYEQHALPNFFPTVDDFKGGGIADEFSEKKMADWSQKIHNQFGIMSAFLFRSLIEQKSAIFKSITIDGFEQIFSPYLYHFHSYAFGDYFKIMSKYQELFQALLQQDSQDNTLKLLLGLRDFWQDLYAYPTKDSNCGTIVTGDILFSVENIKQVIESKIKVKQFYLGPDLTYPIEVKKSCKQKATRNAQRFLQIFTRSLIAVDNEPTAYIFKSFVDGVGKSTLLGNIKNYLKFGLSFADYQTVDNSSSVEFDIFSFSQNIYIVDLPAQMSHATFKPDGLVFIPIEAKRQAKKSEDLLPLLQGVFADNFAEYKKNYLHLLEQAHWLIDNYGPFAKPFYDPLVPELLWARNIILLKKESSNEWLFFRYSCTPKEKDAACLARVTEDGKFEAKILMKIEDAGSEGLKNAEATQMLFYDGILLPSAYDVFLEKLQTQLAERGIKKIVYVDFLSMYSRSSRETIRLNYLLQQCAIIDKDFCVQNTLYDNYICDAQLLARLYKKANRLSFAKNIIIETMLRRFIHKTLENRADAESYCILDQEIVTGAKQFIINAKQTLEPYLAEKIGKKVNKEKIILEERYGSKKIFCNLFQLDWNKLATISDFLQKFFAEEITAPLFKKYFEVFPQTVNASSIDENSQLEGQNGEKIEVLAEIPQDYRNQVGAQMIIRKVRASWFRLIFNLLNAKNINDKLVLEEPLFWDNFIVIKKGANGKIYFLRWPVKNKPSLSRTKIFPQEFSFAQHERTNCTIFGFAQPNAQNEYYIAQCIETVVASALFEYFDQLENKQAEVMPIANLAEGTELYLLTWHNHLRQKFAAEKQQAKNSKKMRTSGLVPTDYQLAISWLTRLFATFETFLKDIDATILVKPNKEDFKTAALLFQKMMLPKYFGLFPTFSFPAQPNLYDPIFPQWLEDA